jgi:hypothetical protein
VPGAGAPGEGVLSRKARVAKLRHLHGVVWARGLRRDPHLAAVQPRLVRGLRGGDDGHGLVGSVRGDRAEGRRRPVRGGDDGPPAARLRGEDALLVGLDLVEGADEASAERAGIEPLRAERGRGRRDDDGLVGDREYGGGRRRGRGTVHGGLGWRERSFQWRQILVGPGVDHSRCCEN